MSSIQLQMDGLDELRDALQKLPEDLANEAADIVLAHADRAQQEITAGYPIRSSNLHPTPRRKSKWFPPGNLHARVVTLKNRSLISTAAIVQSRAPHAWLFENGSATRRTDRGSNRGKMPAAPMSQRMIPKVIRIRARMVAALIALVERAGFEVRT
jgi:hypothetical protein